MEIFLLFLFYANVFFSLNGSVARLKDSGLFGSSSIDCVKIRFLNWF